MLGNRFKLFTCTQTPLQDSFLSLCQIGSLLGPQLSMTLLWWGLFPLAFAIRHGAFWQPTVIQILSVTVALSVTKAKVLLEASQMTTPLLLLGTLGMLLHCSVLRTCNWGAFYCLYRVHCATRQSLDAGGCGGSSFQRATTTGTVYSS